MVVVLREMTKTLMTFSVNFSFLRFSTALEKTENRVGRLKVYKKLFLVGRNTNAKNKGRGKKEKKGEHEIAGEFLEHSPFFSVLKVTFKKERKKT